MSQEILNKVSDTGSKNFSIEEQMLNAAELLHYADKFRGATFSCLVGETHRLADFFLDLKIFYLAHIRMIICCVARPYLKDQIEEWNLRGYAIDYIEAELGKIDVVTKLICTSLEKNRLPLVAIKDVEPVDLPPSKFHEYALELSASSGANRAFILCSKEGIKLNDKLLSHITSENAVKYADDANMNVSAETYKFLTSQQLKYGMELVLLKASAGSLFQEVFTHVGIGTFFSDNHKIEFREAQLSDARDIAFIFKPYVQQNIILPISEDVIVEDIDSFYVFTINKDVVATGRLTSYGDGYELGKLATLPRYRRKGLARSMAEALMMRAKNDGKKFIFSLTVSPKAEELFRTLNFKEVSRDSLPESWKKEYDFSRSSKAFKFEF